MEKIMKRDMDLCREILLYLEMQPFGPGYINIEIEGRTEEEVFYHLRLMSEANLIDAEDVSKSTQKMKWRAKCLTWNGHEFLEASKNNNIWTEAKKTLKDKGVGMVFDIFKALLIQYGKDALTKGGI